MDQKMVVLKPKFYSLLKRHQYILLTLESWRISFPSFEVEKRFRSEKSTEHHF